MEFVARAGAAPAAFRSAWLWVPVLAIGLAATLAGPLPPGGAADAARAAARQLLGGDPALGWAQLAALAFVAGWIFAKPLAVIGAILWLEFRFAADADRSDLVRCWAMQTINVATLAVLATLPSMLNLLPEPLIRVERAGGLAALLLVSVPAFLVLLFVVDLCQYWMHRAYHRFAILWRFHSLHHSLDISVLRNVAHPIEHMVALLCVGIPSALLIGVAQEQLFLLIAFSSIQHHLNHTRLPIHLGWLSGRVLTDRRYHYIHHSSEPAHRDKNFADRFPVLDMLFGTYVAPGERLPVPGLTDKLPPRTVGHYLALHLPDRVPG